MTPAIVHTLSRANDFCRRKTPARPIHAYHNAGGRAGECSVATNVYYDWDGVVWGGGRGVVDIDGYARTGITGEGW